jgi:hypothetical protein
MTECAAEGELRPAKLKASCTHERFASPGLSYCPC